jgi:hypothetical protein
MALLGLEGALKHYYYYYDQLVPLPTWVPKIQCQAGVHSMHCTGGQLVSLSWAQSILHSFLQVMQLSGPLARGSGAPPLCTGTMLDCREAGKAR